MNEEILKNLNNIDKKRYSELLELLDSSVNTNNYFQDNYSFIMDKWHKNNDMFCIPNILSCVYINGECNYYLKGLKKDNIFDLASMSKVYTEYILFCVIKDYRISLYSKISQLVSEYRDIGDLSLFDLLKFKNTFYTKIDIRQCKNRINALKALRTAYIDEEKKGYYLYSDLPIMILTDILELYTKMDYKDLFNKYIIKKHKLNNTYLEIDSKKYISINKKGVNDPKANIMGGFYGHAGVKATAEDFCKFLSIILDNEYYELFTSDASVYKINGERKYVGIIGNSNISDKNNMSLASIYLPSNGFAVQGSVRCHAEACIFNVNGEEYKVITCIFNDLYTQYDNALEYEKKHDVIITRKYKVGKKLLKMCDIRKVLPYDGAYKEIVDLMGKIRTIDLKKYIENNNI